MYYRTNPNELYHHGVKGMKWGVRKKSYEPSSFTASNGMKVAKSKNTYVKVLRKAATLRPVEKMALATYDRNSKHHANTVTNRINTAKGLQRIRKETAAIREYNAATKDAKKGTGTKYLDKAIRKNKIYDAYEKIQTSSSRVDRAIFSDGTRKRAAKYVVDNNMSYSDAVRRARKDAVMYTAASIAALGALNYTVSKVKR